jgi:hypothetical protein
VDEEEKRIFPLFRKCDREKQDRISNEIRAKRLELLDREEM